MSVTIRRELRTRRRVYSNTISFNVLNTGKHGVGQTRRLRPDREAGITGLINTGENRRIENQGNTAGDKLTHNEKTDGDEIIMKTGTGRTKKGMKTLGVRGNTRHKSDSETAILISCRIVLFIYCSLTLLHFYNMVCVYIYKV